MKITFLMRSVVVLIAATLVAGAEANSFGFDQDAVTAQNGTFSVSLAYDFSDFAMFGGAVDIVYDPTAIEFAGFVAALLPGDAVLVTSPIGDWTEPGLISGFGVLSSNFFMGVNSTATLGTFTFSVLDLNVGTTPCGATLCILPSVVNPFISLVGQDETAEILGQGISSVQVSQVPVPAAIWLMLSGMSLLIGLRRNSG